MADSALFHEKSSDMCNMAIVKSVNATALSAHITQPKTAWAKTDTALASYFGFKFSNAFFAAVTAFMHAGTPA